MSHRKTNILIADDHAMFRQGMKAVFECFPEIVVTGEAANGEELLQLLNSRKADVILLDLNMPVMHGAEALGLLRARFPDTRVIIISTDFSPFLLEEYMRLGAHGFVPKNCDIGLLMEAIREVRRQGNCFALSKAIIKDAAMPFHNLYQLTDQEMRVLSLTCKGCPVKEIARLMEIADRTVEFHKTNLYLKTGLKNSADLVAYGIRNGLDRV